MRRSLVLLTMAAGALLWVAALAAAPTAAAPRISAATYMAGSLICHQRPDRSFHRAGSQYPVCARCLGLYAGGVAGVLMWGAIAGVGARPHRVAARFTAPSFLRRLLIIAALPTIASLVLAGLGWWDADNMVRALLGVPLGSAIASVATAGVAGDLR